MKKIIFLIPFFILFLFYAQNVNADWFNTSYGKRINFTLSVPSTSIANIVNNATVVVPVNWDTATEITQGDLRSDGADLTIVNENNTLLNWQWCEYDNPTYGINKANTCIFINTILRTTNSSSNITFYYNFSSDTIFQNTTFNRTFTLRNDTRLLSLIYGGTNGTMIKDREEDTSSGGGVWTNQTVMNITTNMTNVTGLKMTAINITGGGTNGVDFKSNETNPYPDGSISAYWWYRVPLNNTASTYIINNNKGGGSNGGFDIRTSVTGTAISFADDSTTSSNGTFSNGVWFFGSARDMGGTNTNNVSAFNDTYFLGSSRGSGNSDFTDANAPSLFSSGTSGSNFNFTGALQILAIYNGTLTDDEINSTWAVWSNNSLVSQQIEEAFNVAPSIGNTTSPPSPQTYIPNRIYRFNATGNDDNGVQTILFEHNSSGSFVNITAVNNTNINSTSVMARAWINDTPAVNFSYRFIVNDSSNLQSATAYSTFIITNNLTTGIIIKLNNTAGNNYYNNNTAVNITAQWNATNINHLWYLVLNVTNSNSGWIFNMSTSSAFNITNNTWTMILANNSIINVSSFYNITGSNSNYTVTRNDTYIFIDMTPPRSYGFTPTNSTGATYNGSTGIHRFTIRVLDNITTGANQSNVSYVTAELDGVNYTTRYNNDTGIASVNFTGLATGVHTIRWFANDTTIGTNEGLADIQVYSLSVAETGGSSGGGGGGGTVLLKITNGTLTISPSRVVVSTKPGSSDVLKTLLGTPIEFSVKNTGATDMIIDVQFFGDAKQWLKVGKITKNGVQALSQPILKPGEEIIVQVRITIPEDAPLGTYKSQMTFKDASSGLTASSELELSVGKGAFTIFGIPIPIESFTRSLTLTVAENSGIARFFNIQVITIPFAGALVFSFAMIGTFFLFRKINIVKSTIPRVDDDIISLISFLFSVIIGFVIMNIFVTMI